ncbi:efflux RND transporter periplasmic adaptor subunit [Algirhabdus cladophorae]|uniref:efflux RND transporter periplasmic adaptor subunit n=1 Tax=Algirhabdus cladophorae TaxID=3377108 RepID=UPI003B845A55
MRFLGRSLFGMVLLSVTLALFGWAGYSVYSAVQASMEDEGRSRPARERVFAVNVVPFEPTSIVPELKVFGEIDSTRDLDIRPSIAGNVVELSPAFVDGGIVKAGQLLVRLNPADALSALGRADADLAEARAELRDALRALELARDELAAAQDQVGLRETALTRQRDLQNRGVSTDAASEAAELSLSTARQAVLGRRQAEAQAEARIDQAKTRLQRMEIAHADAERAVQDTEIYADFDGVLSDVTVTSGARVSQGEVLGRLVDPTQLQVAFRLSTSQYARLLAESGELLDAPVRVALDVFGVDITAQGKITRESAAVAEGQSGRLLFATLEAPKGLRPGDFVSISITEPALDRVARLPATAVDASGRVLVLGAEDRLESKDVTLLRRQDDDVLVRGRGLRGMEIVAERTPLLGDGIKVRPLRAADRDAAPQAPEMVELTPERRAKLLAFVEGNKRMPEAAKKRVLAQLQETQVPAATVERIESRMGG